MVQWLRILWPIQDTQVQSPRQENPTCQGASKPMSQRDVTTEAHIPWVGALQPEKPPQWEARAPQGRMAPAHCNWRTPKRSNEDPPQPINRDLFNKIATATPHRKRSDLFVVIKIGEGGLEESGQKLETFSYSKYRDVSYMMTSWHCCMMYRRETKSWEFSSQGESFFFFSFYYIYLRRWMLAEPIVVIISQYLN